MDTIHEAHLHRILENRRRRGVLGVFDPASRSRRQSYSLSTQTPLHHPRRPIPSPALTSDTGAQPDSAGWHGAATQTDWQQQPAAASSTMLDDNSGFLKRDPSLTRWNSPRMDYTPTHPSYAAVRYTSPSRVPSVTYGMRSTTSRRAASQHWDSASAPRGLYSPSSWRQQSPLWSNAYAGSGGGGGGGGISSPGRWRTLVVPHTGSAARHSRSSSFRPAASSSGRRRSSQKGGSSRKRRAKGSPVDEDASDDSRSDSSEGAEAPRHRRQASRHRRKSRRGARKSPSLSPSKLDRQLRRDNKRLQETQPFSFPQRDQNDAPPAGSVIPQAAVGRVNARHRTPQRVSPSATRTPRRQARAQRPAVPQLGLPDVRSTLDLRTSAQVLLSGDWFYKWNQRGTEVNPRWLWVDTKSYLLVWSHRETQDPTFSGSVKLESICQITPRELVQADEEGLPKTFYVLMIETTRRVLQIATERKNKADVWFEALNNVVGFVRRHDMAKGNLIAD